MNKKFVRKLCQYSKHRFRKLCFHLVPCFFFFMMLSSPRTGKPSDDSSLCRDLDQTSKEAKHVNQTGKEHAYGLKTIYALTTDMKGPTHTSLPRTKMFFRFDGISMPVAGAPAPRSAAALPIAKRRLEVQELDKLSDSVP